MKFRHLFIILFLLFAIKVRRIQRQCKALNMGESALYWELVGICGRMLMVMADEGDDVCCEYEEGICWRVDSVDKVDASEWRL